MSVSSSLVSAEVIAAFGGFFLGLVFPDKWGLTPPWIIFMIVWLTHMFLFPEVNNSTPEFLTFTFLVVWMFTSWIIQQV